jgi:hypothetical protein
MDSTELSKNSCLVELAFFNSENLGQVGCFKTIGWLELHLMASEALRDKGSQLPVQLKLASGTKVPKRPDQNLTASKPHEEQPRFHVQITLGGFKPDGI